MFKHLEDSHAVIVERGVYKVADVYVYDGGLYLKAKGGFIRLRSDGSTSTPNVRLECLHYDKPLYKDQFSRLCVSNGAGRTELVLTDQGRQFEPANGRKRITG